MSEQTENPVATNASKHLARLVAVQALYQASYGEDKLSDILKHCLDDAHMILNADDDALDEITDSPDAELLDLIVRGVQENRESLEAMLAGAMNANVSAGRMEILLRTILLAGAFELYHHADISSGIIINDYVDVSRAFFNAKEPGLVNAILDKMSKKIRS
ncbi:MAG: transcription antitermination factor NusB [Alphaproteobacteria bacterium]|nr:transcription antitermination factor NusB [Alphaproteobacteria bacterium]